MSRRVGELYVAGNTSMKFVIITRPFSYQNSATIVMAHGLWYALSRQEGSRGSSILSKLHCTMYKRLGHVSVW